MKRIYILLIILLLNIFPQSISANTISLNKNQTTLGIGYTETLKVTVSNDLNITNVQWKSSNEKVATVTNGKVTGVSNGTAIITASINQQRATCVVTVTNDYVAVKGVSLNKTNLNISIGHPETLIATITPSNATNKDVTWTSSDASIATVENGKVTAQKVGTTIITASASGYKATCIVTVSDKIPLKGISLNKTELKIKETETETLKVNYNPSNATNKKVTWKSSNTKIVEVDENGKITGKSAGSATITVVSNDRGYVATCKVTVEALSKKVTNITLDKTELEMIAGETVTLKAIITPDYAENKNVTWETSDKKIATVENGKVTAIKPGTVEIKVISEDGKKVAICKITIKSPPLKSINFEESQKTIEVDKEIKLTLKYEPSNAILEELIWTSENESIATVANGIVRGISIGETTITVTTKDKKISSSIKIIVTEKKQEAIEIKVEGYDLNFDPNVKVYELTIGNEEELIITTNIEKEKVTISGNRKLKNGSIITITIKQSEEESTTYIINIKKSENYTLIFIAIISFLLLLNLIRILVKSKKKK